MQRDLQRPPSSLRPQWIWVGRTGDRIDPEAEERENTQVKTIGKGQVVIDNLVKRVKEIEKDADIPVRAKKGVRSKKVVREEVS